MSTGLERGCLKESGRSPGRPQPRQRRVQVFSPPSRPLAFPEIVTKRSLVFAQIVSPHGKTSPGRFTLALIVLLGSTCNCAELRAVAVTSSQIPRSPQRTAPRSGAAHAAAALEAILGTPTHANHRPSCNSLRTLTEQEASACVIRRKVQTAT